MQDRPYWNMQIEPHLGSPRSAALQLERLRHRVGALFTHAPYVRRRLEERGVQRPTDIRCLEDWPRALPPFTKADYRALIEGAPQDLPADPLGATVRV